MREARGETARGGVLRRFSPALLAVLTCACGAEAADGPRSTTPVESEPVVAIPPVVQPTEATSAPASNTPPAAACVEVHIGLDLRALPTGASQSGIEMFTRGEIEDFRHAARGGTAPQMFYTPGVGGFQARFDGADEATLLTSCRGITADYLRDAPSLPVIMEPAAHTTIACRRCE